MRRFYRSVGAGLVCLCAPFSATVRADVIDAFTSNNGGWTHIGDSTVAPAFVATGGNPGGYITVTDPASGTNEYFVAPAKYLGNQSSALGLTLSYDLLLANAADLPQDDVVLSNGSKTLVYLLSPQPTTTGSWIHETLTLSPSDPNWHLNTNTGAAPTLSDFQSVLGSLTKLNILGDYRSGTETVGLDNVVLHQSPEPASLGLVGATLIALTRHRRAATRA